MAEKTTSFRFASAEDTARFAAAIACVLDAGDTLLLSGPVGAGKTHFARHLIQSILLESEDVPSPTFTLVQTYETTAGLLWHADLYRITSTHDIEELGLTEAFDKCICVVEWPDRLGELTPPDALSLNFAHGEQEDERLVTATWTADRWDAALKGWAVA